MRVADLEREVVEKGLCIGCGFCTSANAGASAPALHMQYSAKYDHVIPIVSQRATNNTEVICPGAKMDMLAIAESVYGSQPADPCLGQYQHIAAAYASDDTIRERSASGGVTTAMLKFLFESQAIDVAYSVVSGGAPYERAGALIRHPDDLHSIHGSVYQPASFGAGLQQLIESEDRFAFVGLPCEVAALEQLKLSQPSMARRHVLSIGLFCGGINRYEGIEYYLKKFGTSLSRANNVNYRYGAWPGKIKLTQDDGASFEIARIRGNSRWNILRYVVAFQGYWMLSRCRICPDQISDFADIAVGDPHLPRFRAHHGVGYSAVIARSDRGMQWYKKAVTAGALKEESLSRNELIESQGYTLDNRRNAKAYVRVAKWLGMSAPDLTVYEEFREAAKFRHYKYAVVDLMKIKFRKSKLLRPLYIPIQIFEYLFITMAPRVFFKRLANLFSNK